MKKVVTQVSHEVPDNRYCIDKETGEKCRWTELSGFGIPVGYCMLHKVNLQMQFNWVPLKCLQCRRSVDI